MVYFDQFQYPIVSNLRAFIVVQLTISTKDHFMCQRFYIMSSHCIGNTYYNPSYSTSSCLHSSNTTFIKVQGTIQSLLNLNFFPTYTYPQAFPRLDLTLGVLSTQIRLLAALPAELIHIYLPTSTFDILSARFLAFFWNRHHNCCRSPCLAFR